MANRAIFLDRDGVLNEDLGYAFRKEDLTIRSGVPEGLAKLKQADFKLLVITNQSGIARGYFTKQDVEQFHESMQQEIRRLGGASLDAFYMCPHHTKGIIASLATACECRKPRPGMLTDAARDYDIDFAQSFLIGDKSDDIEAGLRVGVRGVQILGRYPETHPNALAVVNDFTEATKLILSL